MKKGLYFLLILGVIATMLLAGCTKAVETTTPTTTTATNTPTATQTVDPRIALAIKEGELIWDDTILRSESAGNLGEAFKKKYGLPDSFKISFSSLSTGSETTKVLQEVQANAVNTDIFAVFSPRLFRDLYDAGALAKYNAPDEKYFLSINEKWALTHQAGYYLSLAAYNYAPVTNPTFYPDPITSWNDLLNPVFSNHKMDFISADTSESGIYTYYGIRQRMPLSWAEAMAAQKPIWSETSVEKTAKVTRGETLMAITSAHRNWTNFLDSGVVLRANFPKEGIVLFGETYAILAKAPHPNAASLFLDYLLSDEGYSQIIGAEALISCKEGFNVAALGDVARFTPDITTLNVVPLDMANIPDADLQTYRDEFIRLFR